MATRRGGRRGSSMRRSVGARVSRRTSRSSRGSRGSRSSSGGSSRSGYGLTQVYRKAKKTLIGS
jgi:hypothetical protein